MGRSKRSDITRECLKTVVDVGTGRFNMDDVPSHLKQAVSNIVKASYAKRDPDGKTDFILTSEGKRYAKLQGWI
jgi:hypothetical protein